MSVPGPDFVVLREVDWTSLPLAAFEEMADVIEERFGPPLLRDQDSNGGGPFDCSCLRFSCGLEVALWRYQLGRGLREINPAVDPSTFETFANQMDLEHIGFHIGVAMDRFSLWEDRNQRPLAPPASHSWLVLRQDDHGNRVEMKRATSRCEAETFVRAYEARGHKQTYWVAKTS